MNEMNRFLDITDELSIIPCQFGAYFIIQMIEKKGNAIVGDIITDVCK